MFFEDSENNDRYKDIINLPHYQSQTRAHMSLHDRAAQFAPFAALTGHDAAISETARLTEDKPDIDDEVKLKINDILRMMMDTSDGSQEVNIEYFVPDARKSGGACITYKGGVHGIDEYLRTVTLDNGKEISFDDILDIECEVSSECELSDSVNLYNE